MRLKALPQFRVSPQDSLLRWAGWLGQVLLYQYAEHKQEREMCFSQGKSLGLWPRAWLL